MRSPRAIFATIVAFVALGAGRPAHADYYVVVSERSHVATLTRQQVLHLFMGRARTFPDGTLAAALDLSDDTLRAGFYRQLSGMTLPQVNSYWARLMFSGRNLPPQRLDSPDTMIERVKNNPAAIGWLPEAPRQKGLRTVLVLKAAQ
jgi:hypothetical protein